MAILNSIRKRGIFLILIIALALFAFILSDVLTKGGGGQIEDTIATVNGTDIPRKEFMEQVDATQRAMGPSGAASQAMNIVWERELRRVLFEEQYNELGLTAEAAAVNDALRTNLANDPTFQDESGQFSQLRLQEYVRDVKMNNNAAYQQWLTYVESTKQGILQEMYLTMLKGGLIATIADGEQAYRFENDKVNIQYVHIPYSSIPDTDITVSDDEIAAYVKAHPKQFEVEPQVDIQYVLYEDNPSEADIEEAQNDIATLLNDRIEFNAVTEKNDTIVGFASTTDNKEFVNAYSDQPYNDRWWFKKDLPKAIADTIFSLEKGAIFGPYKADNTYNLTKVTDTRQMADSAKARHILIRYQGLANASEDVTRSKEAAEKLADSLLKVIQQNKGKFEALAARFSEDNSNKDKGGDLGFFGPGRMVPEFNDFVFDNPAGKIGVVETNFGYHVVEIEEQKNLQKAIKVATVTKEIEASEQTLNTVFSEAANLEEAVRQGDFATVAKEKELDLRPVNRIGKMDANIPGIGSNRAIVTWAFNEDTKVGNVSRFNVPNGYVIAQLTRKNPKGLLSVAEASSRVTPILRNEKKAKQIRASVTGTTLDEIAASKNVTVQSATALTRANPTITGAGNEPKVVGAAFGKKAGEMTDLIDGKTGVFKVRVMARNNAPEFENYASYANQLTDQARPALNTSIYNALKNAAEIEDNRAVFY